MAIFGPKTRVNPFGKNVAMAMAIGNGNFGTKTKD